MYHYHHPVITSVTSSPMFMNSLTVPLVTATAPVAASYPYTYFLTTSSQPVTAASFSFESKPAVFTTATTIGEAKLLAGTDIPIYGFAPVGSIRLRPIEYTIESRIEKVD